MKYVGATDWFIRWPFILEGMTLGFFGALIANFVINGTYAALLSRIYATLAFYQWFRHIQCSPMSIFLLF